MGIPDSFLVEHQLASWVLQPSPWPHLGDLHESRPLLPAQRGGRVAWASRCAANRSASAGLRRCSSSSAMPPPPAAKGATRTDDPPMPACGRARWRAKQSTWRRMRTCTKYEVIKAAACKGKDFFSSLPAPGPPLLRLHCDKTLTLRRRQRRACARPGVFCADATAALPVEGTGPGQAVAGSWKGSRKSATHRLRGPFAIGSSARRFW